MVVNPEMGAKAAKCEVSDFSKDVAASVEFHSFLGEKITPS
jgi:hypothetical protein